MIELLAITQEIIHLDKLIKRSIKKQNYYEKKLKRA